jgi:hypothetical protein
MKKNMQCIAGHTPKRNNSEFLIPIRNIIAIRSRKHKGSIPIVLLKEGSSEIKCKIAVRNNIEAATL